MTNQAAVPLLVLLVSHSFLSLLFRGSLNSTVARIVVKRLAKSITRETERKGKMGLGCLALTGPGIIRQVFFAQVEREMQVEKDGTKANEVARRRWRRRAVFIQMHGVVKYLAGSLFSRNQVITGLHSRPYASGPPCRGHILVRIQVVIWYLLDTATRQVFLPVHWNEVVVKCHAGVQTDRSFKTCTQPPTWDHQLNR
jgi:hypothetical protein